MKKDKTAKLAPTLDWDRSYDTGHSGIDAEHRHLLQIIGMLQNSRDVGDMGDSLGAIFVALRRYTFYHFAHEHQLMKEYGVNRQHQTKHRAAHDLFVEKINEATRAANIDPVSVTRDMLSFLSQWLLNHIMTIDVELVNEIRLLSIKKEAQPGTPTDAVPNK